MRRAVFLLLALGLAAAACRSTAEVEVGSGITFPARASREGVQTVRLEGATWGSGATAIVFAHSRPTTMDAWAPFARTMATRGFLSLTFNFRGYGLSEGVRDASSVDLDVEGAIEKAMALGARRVILVGASMGGTASVVAASRKDVAGVVSMSAPARFGGLDAAEAAAALRAPSLFVAAEQDGSAASDARALHARAAGTKELLIVPGSAHGTDLLEGSTAARVSNAVAQFLVDRRR